MILFYFIFAASVGRQTELSSGCIVGAKCHLSTNECLEENTVIYGEECRRRVQQEHPFVSILSKTSFSTKKIKCCIFIEDLQKTICFENYILTLSWFADYKLFDYLTISASTFDLMLQYNSRHITYNEKFWNVLCLTKKKSFSHFSQILGSVTCSFSLPHLPSVWHMSVKFSKL